MAWHLQEFRGWDGKARRGKKFFECTPRCRFIFPYVPNVWNILPTWMPYMYDNHVGKYSMTWSICFFSFRKFLRVSHRQNFSSEVRHDAECHFSGGGRGGLTVRVKTTQKITGWGTGNCPWHSPPRFFSPNLSDGIFLNTWKTWVFFWGGMIFLFQLKMFWCRFHWS